MHEHWHEFRGRRWAHRMREGYGPMRGRHRGGRHRLGRFFAHGDLRFLILKLIDEKPRHGYEVIKEIEDRLAGAYTPSPGVIYPTLTLLEELGWARVRETVGAKKLYEVTQEGVSALDANRATVEAIFARIEEIGGERGETAPQIRRAMHNLKVALRLRLSRGDLSAEQAKAIAAALDAAASAVEDV
jgi:DNA-binding PadR family transcriptional regulator